MTATPRWKTVSPADVSSQLPPDSEAKSTIALPARIDSTISLVTSTGAGRPGIWAVEITKSISRMWAAISWSSRWCCSSESALA